MGSLSQEGPIFRKECLPKAQPPPKGSAKSSAAHYWQRRVPTQSEAARYWLILAFY